MSLFSRQVTYLKYTFSVSLAKPLNAVLAIIIVVLVGVIYFSNKSDKVSNAYQMEVEDYMYQRVQKVVDWSKHVKMYEPVELEAFHIDSTHRDKCPACFGEDMCKSIELGQLKMDKKGTPEKLMKKGIYFGKWNDNLVVIKSLVDENTFQHYDETLCKNITGDKNCDIAKAITEPKSFVSQQSILDPSSLLDAHVFGNRKRPSLDTTCCASKDLVSNLASVFDNDGDDELNPSERAQFYTSFSLNPEATIFRGARKKMLFGFDTAQEAFHGSKFYGACGRVVVLQYGGMPVSHLLDAPWDVRVDLAISLLGLVGQLEASDLRWYFVYGDFQLQNFVVDTDGFVGIVDAKEIGLVDLDQHPPPFPSDDGDDPDLVPGICNAECFAEFANQITDPNTPEGKRPCRLISIKAGQLMNSLMCKMLSDFPEHQEPGRRFRGLLHSPPHDEKEDLQSALAECVTETEAGGRDTAVNNLYTLFDYYLTAGSSEQKL